MKGGENKMIKMKVAGVIIHPRTNSPVVILKEESGNNLLPIWIGFMEASAIASKLEGVEMPRPMTHDLLNNCISKLGVIVEKVVVTDLIENTYYANIYLKTPEGELLLDSRPSDAIALALRAGVPIFVKEGVLDKTRELESSGLETESEKKELEELLKQMEDEDFGKYKM